MKKNLEIELDALHAQLVAMKKKYDELASKALENQELIPEIRRNLAKQIDLNGWLGHYHELPDLYQKYAAWCLNQGDAEAARRASGTDIEYVTASYAERRCLHGFEEWKPLYD
ncbi:MAG TPA: hypothetical protein VK206_12450 [Anaerolineales bacterium]|nr:hypothetical protein [Anaerolineales bacterium]